ncbi:MAG: ECF transporter S component [Clostridia bacterium]|nr:ECF transporter S component [Clostridia bacterium]
MKNYVRRLLLSDLLVNSSTTQRIAYIALMTAFCAVGNMFFEIKFADIQFSLTIVICALTGIIIGPIFGSCACFLGDLVGFLYNSGGFTYMPWIGIAMAMVALISGLVVNGLDFNFKGDIYVKLLIVAVLTFLVCTIGINTTAFWLIYNNRKVPYFAYVITRVFVQGQIWNSLVNYSILIGITPLILELKIFKKK